VQLVLDAYPLLVLFLKQRGWEIVDSLLEQAVDEGYTHLISSINVGEILYTLGRDYGEKAAHEKLDRIKHGPIEIIDPSLETVVLAAKMKAAGGISYADCFAGALALERDLVVLTGDKEFERLVSFGVRIQWLPPDASKE
jgi:predicted nucleic acid-binding protein